MRAICLLLILLTPWPALAAVATATEAPPEYDVELLVFLRDANPADEFWSEDVEPPNPGMAVATVDGGRPPLSADTSAAPLPVSPPLVQALPPAAYQLTPHAEALRRQGLTPLVHAAWRQPVNDRDNEDWLWLDGGVLRGLVRISLGRYLHVDTDLALLAGETRVIRQADHRRLRSGELNYLDHPGYGILVLISRPEENANPKVQNVNP